MPAGQRFPSESRSSDDPRTGTRIRQLTSHPSIHHHPFYYLPAYDDAMRWLFLVSHRTGRAEIFAERRDTGELVQLTDRDGLSEWSIHPSPDGRWVYFTDRAGGWRVSTDTFRAEQLFDFSGGSARPDGMVGAAMGTTSVSRCGRWWAVPVRFGSFSRMLVCDLVQGTSSFVLEAAEIGHPEFHPHDSTLLRFAGSFRERIWVVQRDGGGCRLVFQRDAAAKQWIVHETWNPTPPAGVRAEILTADWPRGVLGIDIDTGAARQVAAFNAWHPMIRRDGRLMVADTNFPDIGLQLFDPRPGGTFRATLCHPDASSRGDHWAIGHCPYDDGPVNVYAPQHTHPHPNFSPDGRFVVFTSDVSGFAQVYEVEIPSSMCPPTTRESSS